MIFTSICARPFGFNPILSHLLGIHFIELASSCYVCNSKARRAHESLQVKCLKVALKYTARMTKFKSYLQANSQNQSNRSGAGNSVTGFKRDQTEKRREERSGGQERPAPRVQMQQRRQCRESRWWRSCWNGNQLDSGLLYKTVKAQQERRLAGSLLAGEESGQVVAPVFCELVGQRDGCMYATPRPSARTTLPSGRSPPSASCSPTSSSTSSTSSAGPSNSPSGVRFEPQQRKSSLPATQLEVGEENPLSDPLYASILGTSKQLQGISGVKTTSRECKTNSQNNATPTKSRSSCLSIVENSHYAEISHAPASSESDSFANGKQEKERTRETTNFYSNQQPLPASEESDAASIQLRSLVESCLEVHRATQNSSLLPLEHQTYENEKSGSIHEHADKTVAMQGESADQQM